MRTLLLLAFWLPATAFAQGRVADILEDQRVHGYPSPAAAIARLHAADDVPTATTPVEARHRYEAALAALAIIGEQPALADDALSRLQRMAEQEACVPCALTWHSLAARAALDRGDLRSARAHLRLGETQAGRASDAQRLQLLYAEGSFERAAGNPAGAIAKALEAQALAERLGNNADRVRLMILMAVVDAELGYLDRARELIGEAYRLASRMGFTEAMALAQLDEAYIETLNGHRDRQRQLLTSALAIAQRTPGLDYIAIGCLSNLADNEQNRGDFAAMLDDASRGVVLAERVGDDTGRIFALANKGIALGELGRIDEAAPTLRAAIDLADRLGMQVHVVGITRELVRLLEKAGRYRDALAAMHRSEAASEQVTRQEREKAVIELQEKYASERKTREIERLSAQNRVRDAELAARAWKQRLWAALALASVLGGALLVQWLRRQASRLREDNAHLAEEVLHDPLTGAGNRRGFDRLMATLSAARGSDNTRTVDVGLIVVDLDHFKRINDRHGHDAGDAVLVEVVRRLRGLLRAQDAVVRWGGEEFVLVLPGVPVASLHMLAGRVLHAVGDASIRCGAQEVRVTVSAGATVHAAGGATVEGAFRLADAALYLAKQRGRNRAVCVDAMADAGEAAAADLVGAERRGDVRIAEVPGPARAMPAMA